MTKGKPGAGLHGPDKQQAHLRDERDGTYDEAGVSRSAEPVISERTRHQAKQVGADVREGVPNEDSPHPTRTADLPEGLRREPKGPYDKDAGRRGKSTRRSR
jgi:hypothetical protein